MPIRDDPIRDDTSTAPTRDTILALLDELIDTVRNTPHIVTYDQPKPALLAIKRRIRQRVSATGSTRATSAAGPMRSATPPFTPNDGRRMPVNCAMRSMSICSKKTA